MHKLELSGYQYFILDASFHKAPLHKPLVEELAQILRKKESGCRIYAASTFQSDLRRNLRLLDRHDPERAALYRGNLELLKDSGIRPEILSYSDYSLNDKRAHYDTRSLISRLTRRYAAEKILLLTCDDSLFEELAVNDCPINIYHLYHNKKYDPASLSQMKQKFELEKDDRLITGIAKKNPAVCDGNAVQLSLAAKANRSGNEARIYNVEGEWNGQGDILAKIYNQHTEKRDDTAAGPRTAYFSHAQAMNIRMLCNKKADLPKLFPWAAMPLEPVYDRLLHPGEVDPDRIVGHLMAEFKDVKALDKTSLCIGTKDVRAADALEACLTLVEQTLYMNSYGIHISDVSDNNFGLRYNDGKMVCDTVYMFDAGSFAYKGFFSDGMNGDVRPVRHTNRPASKKEVFAYCAELLYMQVLHILTRGLAIDTNSGRLPLLDPKDNCYAKRFCIPRNLWLLLKSLYEGKHSGFSLEILAEELYAAMVSLRRSGLTQAQIREKGEHPAVEWPQEEDILPCQAAVHKTAAAAVPVSGEFQKELPAVHRAESDIVRASRHNGGLQVRREPIPPVHTDAPGKLRIALIHGAVLLILALVFVTLDMLNFASAELQFELAAWVQARFGGIWETITDLGSDISGLGAEFFQQWQS